MNNEDKPVILGFPFTEEDVHGVHRKISNDHLRKVFALMIELNQIFKDSNNIKINNGDVK